MNNETATTIVNDFLENKDLQTYVTHALDYLAKLSAAVAKTHGFHDDEAAARSRLKENPRTAEESLTWLEAQLLTAEFGRVMSECGEAIENIRKPGPDDKCPDFPGWQVEAIDTMIRLFDTLGKRNIRPGEIFVAKTLVNNSRAYKHNKNS